MGAEGASREAAAIWAASDQIGRRQGSGRETPARRGNAGAVGWCTDSWLLARGQQAQARDGEVRAFLSTIAEVADLSCRGP